MNSSRRSSRPVREAGSEISVYSGRECLGVIILADDGRHVAHDADGRRLGVFATSKEAAGKILESSRRPT